MKSAECAASAGDDAARSAALAYAATVARRFAAGFPEPVPDDRVGRLIDEAARAAPPDDLAVAAQLAAARAWSADGIPGQRQAADGLAAARRAGDPVLITGALDAAVSAVSFSGGCARHTASIPSAPGYWTGCPGTTRIADRRSSTPST